MQLKWNHRFVSASNDANSQRTTPADRSNTASPMATQSVQAKPSQRPSPVLPAASPLVDTVSATQQPPPQAQKQQTSAAASPQLVTANCANRNCGAPVGQFVNSWSQITNSYFTQTQPSYRAVGLRQKGDVKPPSTPNSIVAGCLIQSLVCNHCSDVLGFLCVQAPDHKAIFRQRQFLKLGKIVLTTPLTKTIVTPDVDKALEDNRRPSTIDTNSVIPQIDPMSPSTPNPQKDDCTDADMAAVRGTNEGTYTWREAHELWYSKTRQTLSPSAFGKRILKLGGGKQPKAPQSQAPPPQQQPMQQPMQQPSQRPPSNPDYRQSGHHGSISHPPPHTGQPPSLPSLQAAAPRSMSLSHHSEGHFRSSVDLQRRDPLREMERIDAGMRHLQSTVETLQASVDALRQECRARASTGGITTEDQAQIDLLSDTVSNLSSKTGEVDGIKLQIEALKRRVKRVEEASGAPSTPAAAHAHDAFNRSSNAEQRYESPFPMLQAPNPGSINGLKRPIGPQFTDTPDPKRPRPDTYSDHHPSGSAPYPTQQPQYMPINNGEHAGNYGQYQPRRGPGRPRKYPTPDQGAHHSNPSSANPTPQALTAPGSISWEHDSSQIEVDADGFYRPLAPGPGVDHLTERGRLIRRGTLGGALAIDNKRTRQRPIRNSDGVLIRKDGKPDMRSVSSAQNLKRFYDRKVAEGGTELEMRRDGDDSHSGSPGTSHRGSGDPAMVNLDSGDDRDRDYGDVDHEDDINMDTSRRASEYQGDPNSATSAESEQGLFRPSEHPQTRPPPQQHDQGSRDHASIMRQMFPHGVSGERTKLDEATDHLFEPGQRGTDHSRMQMRDAVVKKEVVEDSGLDTSVAEENCASNSVPATLPVETNAQIDGTADAAAGVAGDEDAQMANVDGSATDAHAATPVPSASPNSEAVPETQQGQPSDVLQAAQPVVIASG